MHNRMCQKRSFAMVGVFWLPHALMLFGFLINGYSTRILDLISVFYYIASDGEVKRNMFVCFLEDGFNVVIIYY